MHIITVSIFYLEVLQKRLDLKNTMTQVTKGHGKKPTPVDLDGCVEDVHEVMNIQAQKERDEIKRLQRKLMSCN